MKDKLNTSGTALLLELGHAANRNGYTPDDLKWLSVGDRMARFLPIIRASSETNILNPIIDLSADLGDSPARNWPIKEHHKGDTCFKFDPIKIGFYLSVQQKDGGTINGHELRKELMNQSVFNANLLDYLLKNPHLIPEEWKKDAQGNIRYIYFWGTIYDLAGGLSVRCLSWREHTSRWHWDSSLLDSNIGEHLPAAYLMS